MPSVSSRIWARVAVSISSDDNHNTMGTSKQYIIFYLLSFCWSSYCQYSLWWLSSIFFRAFVCSLPVVVLMRQYCLQSSQFPFLLFFLTYIANQRHLWDVMPYALSLGLVWFVWFYGISTFVGYLTPNQFLCYLHKNWSVLLKTVQLSISTQFDC